MKIDLFSNLISIITFRIIELLFGLLAFAFPLCFIADSEFLIGSKTNLVLFATIFSIIFSSMLGMFSYLNESVNTPPFLVSLKLFVDVLNLIFTSKGAVYLAKSFELCSNIIIVNNSQDSGRCAINKADFLLVSFFLFVMSIFIEILIFASKLYEQLNLRESKTNRIEYHNVININIQQLQ